MTSVWNKDLLVDDYAFNRNSILKGLPRWSLTHFQLISTVGITHFQTSSLFRTWALNRNPWKRRRRVPGHHCPMKRKLHVCTIIFETYLCHRLLCIFKYNCYRGGRGLWTVLLKQFLYCFFVCFFCSVPHQLPAELCWDGKGVRRVEVSCCWDPVLCWIYRICSAVAEEVW